MKRILALILAFSLVLSLCLSGMAESSVPQGGPDGTPPEGMGQPPEGMTPPDGMGEPPEGGPGGMSPEGGPGGAPGEAPGRQQSQVDGQLGSWSMGGTDADSIDGDDYAYDAALYVTADGIDEEKSATDRIYEGTYDDSAATGIVIDDSESGHNGILVVDAD